jgi:hypothetical protein
MLPLFLGFQVILDAARAAIAPTPKADARLKDAAKIADDITEKRKRQADELLNVPFYGTIQRIFAMDLTGAVVLDQTFTNGAGYEIAIAKLNSLFLQGRDSLTTDILAYGFDGLDRMRQLAIEGARLGVPLNGHLWYHASMSPHVIVDPFDYILKREHQAHLPVGRFCEYIGRPIPQDLYTNAQTQAMYARNLVLSVGLPQ